MAANQIVSRGSNPYMASGFGSADSSPASPVEKFFTLKHHYMSRGKEGKGEEMRDVVLNEYVEQKGWPADHYLILALSRITDEDEGMSPERARLVRMDDREAKAELERQKRIDEQRRREIDEGAGVFQNEDISDLRRQIAELTALLKPAPVVAAEELPAAPEPEEETTGLQQAAVEEAQKIATGQPTLASTRAELIRYADAHNLGLPERLRANHIAKSEILEWILEAQEKDV